MHRTRIRQAQTLLLLIVTCFLGCPVDIGDTEDDDTFHWAGCPERSIEVLDSRYPESDNPYDIACLFLFDQVWEIEGPPIQTPLGDNSLTWLFFPWNNDPRGSVSSLAEIELFYVDFRFGEDIDAQKRPFGTFHGLHRYYFSINSAKDETSYFFDDTDYVFDREHLEFSGLELFASRTGTQKVRIEEVSAHPIFYYLRSDAFPENRFLMTRGIP